MTEKAGCLEGSLRKVVKALLAADHPLLSRENLAYFCEEGFELDRYWMFFLVSQSKVLKNDGKVCFDDLKKEFPECPFLEAVHVEMHRQEGTLLSKTSEIEAVVHGHFNLLQLIYRENNGLLNPKDIMHKAAEYNRLEMLDWIYSKTN